VLAGAHVEVVCIDPHAGSDRGPQEIRADADRGAADHEAFHANLARAGVAARVRHVRAFSDAALEQVPGPVDVLFVDGAHRFGPARPTSCAGATGAAGGRMLVHDAWSSVGVTLALLTTTVVGAPVALPGSVGLAGGVRARRRRRRREQRAAPAARAAVVRAQRRGQGAHPGAPAPRALAVLGVRC
jgi:hypothetical protein